MCRCNGTPSFAAGLPPPFLLFAPSPPTVQHIHNSPVRRMCYTSQKAEDMSFLQYTRQDYIAVSNSTGTAGGEGGSTSEQRTTTCTRINSRSAELQRLSTVAENQTHVVDWEHKFGKQQLGLIVR